MGVGCGLGSLSSFLELFVGLRGGNGFGVVVCWSVVLLEGSWLGCLSLGALGGCVHGLCCPYLGVLWLSVGLVPYQA